MERNNERPHLIALKQRRGLVFLFVTLYLVVACFWQDIGLRDVDNALYLESGKHVHLSMFLTDITSMPLYGLWFKFLNFLIANPIRQHFISWGLLVITAAALPLLFRMRLAWLYTAVLVSMPLFQVRPYVSLFASIFAVAGLIAVERLRLSVAQAGFVSCLVCFVLTYCRPEYSYGVFFSAAFVILTIALRWSHMTKRSIYAIAIPTLCVACIVFFVMKHSDSGRSGVAFAQHYNLVAEAKGELKSAEPWDSPYAYQVFGIIPPSANKNFGNHTIFDFLRAKPRLFFAHVIDDLKDPKTLLFLILIAGLTGFPWISAGKSALRPASAYLLLMALPTIISVLLVYSDPHYMAIIIPTAVLVVMLLIPLEFAQRISSMRWIPVLAVLLILLGGAREYKLMMGPQHDARIGLNTIACLRDAIGTNQGTREVVYDPIGIQDAFLGSAVSHVTMEDESTWPDFQDWVIHTHPRAIVIIPAVESRYKVSSSSIAQFLEGSGDYTAHACPGRRDMTVFAPR